jgi:hypothetical protein
MAANTKRKATARFEAPVGTADEILPRIVGGFRHRVYGAGLVALAMLEERRDSHTDRPTPARDETEIRDSIRRRDAHVHLQIADSVVARGALSNQRPAPRFLEAFPPRDIARARSHDERRESAAIPGAAAGEQRGGDCRRADRVACASRSSTPSRHGAMVPTQGWRELHHGTWRCFR